MNILPTVLLDECLFFLPWDEYYDVCKSMKIKFKFDLYVKITKQQLLLKDVINKQKEYLDVVKALKLKNKYVWQYHLDLAIEKNYFNILKYLCKEKGKKPDAETMTCACKHDRLSIIKYLHLVHNVPISEYDLQYANEHVSKYVRSWYKVINYNS